jgi:hypothetical protein
VPNDQSSDKVPEIEEYVKSVAPEDVVRTLDWLLMNRWVVSNAKYGGGESFGNAQIEFDRDGDRVTVTRDRSQWCMHLQRAAWKQPFDLGIVVDTMTGRSEWARDPANDRLPEQLPPGTSWLDALPSALAWTAREPNVVNTLRVMLLERSRQLFPSAKLPRGGP